MNFLVRVVRFLFWLLVISWSVRLLGRLVGWIFEKTADHRPPADVAVGAQTRGAARRLVRDPVCGMHVDQTLSIPLREGGDLLHFCSAACRDKYAVSAERFAANG